MILGHSTSCPAVKIVADSANEIVYGVVGAVVVSDVGSAALVSVGGVAAGVDGEDDS